MSRASLVVVTAALVGAAPGAAQPPGDSLLRRTPDGTIYHANCANPVDRALIVFLQGTGLPPDASRRYLRQVGDRTGRCVLAVPYENAKLVASYCIADSATGAQDADCLTDVLAAKAAGDPPRVETRSGGTLEVSRDRSAEGALLLALRAIGLTRYLSPDRASVAWDRVVLTGASQGAQVALFIALTRHRVAGVGSIVGGVLPVAGSARFPSWVTERGLTPAERIRAFHHQDDSDAFRRSVYAAMGVPDANVRTTAVSGGDCAARPHPCVIIDDYLPLQDGIPKVVDDWVWVSTPER
ncbi:MAG: hypothetical protein AB7R55_20300 [Gemmatimonadales bacterium]